ncbi:MAG: hypothetical protein M3443_08895 [Actinomycetota bacterium]|nr:hypothetical protein [Actinomycetota bacterium]
MFTHRGIAVDSFARIGSGCPITCEVVGNEVQFEFGDPAHCLNLVITDEALERFAAMVTEALTQRDGVAPDAFSA